MPSRAAKSRRGSPGRIGPPHPRLKNFLLGPPDGHPRRSNEALVAWCWGNRCTQRTLAVGRSLYSKHHEKTSKKVETDATHPTQKVGTYDYWNYW